MLSLYTAAVCVCVCVFSDVGQSDMEAQEDVVQELSSQQEEQSKLSIKTAQVSNVLLRFLFSTRGKFPRRSTPRVQ